MSKDVTQTASVRLKAPATKDPVALLDYIEELHTQLEVAERDREIQNAVFRISDLASASEDLQGFYASLHEIVKDLTSVDAFYIALYHTDEQCISFPYYHDPYDDVQDQESLPLQNRSMIPVNKLENSLTWKVIRTNEVMRVRADAEVGGIGKDAVDWMGIPLRRDGQPIGVVSIQSYQDSFRYTDMEVDMMIFMANHIGTALQRRRDSLAIVQANLDLQATAEKLAGANEELTQKIEENAAINKRMLSISHEAGKSEVATGVLHNVGNVLNSINVSAQLVQEFYAQSKLPSLRKTIDLINAQEDSVEFLANDPRAKVIPSFLEGLVEILEEEQSNTKSEIQKLIEHVNHVKVVVAMQQSFAGVSGLQEPVCLFKLFDDAEMLLSNSIFRHEIELTLDFEDLPKVMLERQRLLQVVVNLLKNAKDALTAGRMKNRRLTVRARRDQEWLCIEVEDNGVGIAKDNLAKIFSHGFTTKDDGHGFGLHTCANTIQELGGKLTARSEGLGKGATFAIRLPFEEACVEGLNQERSE